MDFELLLLRATSVLFLVMGIPAPMGLIAHTVIALRLKFMPADCSYGEVSIHQRFAIEPEALHEQL